MKKEFSGYCDWCDEEKDTLVEHKDVDEGFAGRVYDVCKECRQEEARKLDLNLIGEE